VLFFHRVGEKLVCYIFERKHLFPAVGTRGMICVYGRMGILIECYGFCLAVHFIHCIFV